MVPPIAPIGLDYIAAAAKSAGLNVDVLDLCLAQDPDKCLKDYFAVRSPQLVGISFRNVDDCFWPSAKWFVPDLAETVQKIKSMTDAPVVLGGVGFSIFPERIVEFTGADFGIRGDGEQATVTLHTALSDGKRFDTVEGLIWRQNGRLRSNAPAWPEPLSLPTQRNAIDNRAYFAQGGQIGIETKRGCNRRCIYCADPLAKGPKLRLRRTVEVADEIEALMSQGVEVFHLCDSEFNIPREHAQAVSEEFVRRSFGKKIRWYTYMAVVPFDAELAAIMRKAGCVGINFTGDSGCQQMLHTYRQSHSREDLASAIRLCREDDITVMIDLMLGGPGETPYTAGQTIDFIKQIGPDCAGAALGIRIYPGTEMARIVMEEGRCEDNPNLRRKYDGPVDFFQSTFYISHQLGSNAARVIKDLIAGDKRFFEPTEELPAGPGQGKATDHNYSDNTELVEAIKAGHRGAYWDILRRLRK